jgi:hypothetical protein
MKHDPEIYFDRGWVKFPNELTGDNEKALKWLMDYDICIYPGLNTRTFDITDFDLSLTIMYDKSQPRRFPVTELYFHK